jgi:hypothetical protein
MSETSPNLGLSLVMPAQAQKHVMVNESLLRLDALVQPQLQSRILATQPSAPQEGQAWLIPTGATGVDWSSMSAGSLAIYRDGYWTEIAPREGWTARVLDEKAGVVFDGTDWRLAGSSEVIAQSDSGAKTRGIIVEETLNGLTGASVTTVALIPARAIVFCVSVRVRGAITGATSFDCGLSGEVSKFGGSLGISAGSSNLGVIGPTAFYSDTPVVLSANGGSFTAGEVAIAIHAWLPEAPDP